ncbi:MAG: hypothetical protein ACKVTZ_08345 [Bacteroidia bacterium]
MFKKILFSLAIIALSNSLFAQKNKRVITTDIKMIQATLQTSSPGTVTGNIQGIKGTSKTYPSVQRNLSTAYYFIKLQPLVAGIEVDSIFYRGYGVGNVYENPLTKGEIYQYNLVVPQGNGNMPYPIKNIREGTVLFRYKKAGKIYYYQVTQFEERNREGL